MSSLTIATLPRMSRDALCSLLLASVPTQVAVVDVRDSGGTCASDGILLVSL
jgi:Cdc25 family phosphatase